MGPSGRNPPGHFPVAGPRLDQLRCREPHLLTPGPRPSIQPAAIGVCHDPVIPHNAAPVRRTRSPQSL